MKTICYLICLFIFLGCTKKDNTDVLTYHELEENLAYVSQFMDQHASYVHLNGYNYKTDFEKFKTTHKNDPISAKELGIFLTRTIGKIGDRHANVRGYDLSDQKYLPFVCAPYKNQLIAINYDRPNKVYNWAFPGYPFVKSIDKTPIDEFINQILPEEVLAPKAAYVTRAAKVIRDIDEAYDLMGKSLQDSISISLSNFSKSRDTTFKVPLTNDETKPRRWYEEFYIKFHPRNDTAMNQPDYFKRLFSFSKAIGYVYIPEMASKNSAPLLFDYIGTFMEEMKDKSQALIIDVRENGGGSRDLIFEMAGYLVHPDSIYIVNVARQRAQLPLPDDIQQSLHGRYLYAYDAYDKKEQSAIDDFMQTFTPMYNLDDKKYSSNYYALFNGSKLSKNKYYYNKPVYILANERSFSAASIMVALFKGIPNIKIVGETTDGSSGNSKKFELPNSDLRGKISTMVSFQKNGQILDGYGTAPDIRIERGLDQIFWTKDTQLDSLKQRITAGLDN